MPRKCYHYRYRGTRPKKAADAEEEVEVYCELCEINDLKTSKII